MANTINKVSNETREKIRKKSVANLPNKIIGNPELVKQAFTGLVIDSNNSALGEIDRVVEEINNKFDYYDLGEIDSEVFDEVEQVGVFLYQKDGYAGLLLNAIEDGVGRTQTIVEKNYIKYRSKPEGGGSYSNWNELDLSKKYVKTDGTVAMEANLDANAYKVKNLANGTNAGDAVNKSQLDLKADAVDLDNYLKNVWTDVANQTTTFLNDELVINRGNNVYKTTLANLLTHTTITELFTIVTELPELGMPNKIYLVPEVGTIPVYFVSGYIYEDAEVTITVTPEIGVVYFVLDGNDFAGKFINWDGNSFTEVSKVNKYAEYIWVDDAFERIGTVEIDLSNYFTKEDINDLLNNKVDKVADKGLSTNDYTTTEKNKLTGIEANAQKNIQSDWNATSGDAFIKNKPIMPTKVSDLANDNNYATEDYVNTLLQTISIGAVEYFMEDIKEGYFNTTSGNTVTDDSSNSYMNDLPIIPNDDLHINFKIDGYEISYATYDGDGIFISPVSSFVSSNFVIPLVENYRYKFRLRRINKAEFDPSDIPNIIKFYSGGNPVDASSYIEVVNKLYSVPEKKEIVTIHNFDTVFKSGYFNEYIIPNLKWGYFSSSTGNTELSPVGTECINEILLEPLEELEILLLDSSYTYRVGSYNNDDSYIGATDWLNDKHIVEYSEGKKYRLQIKKVNGSLFTFEDVPNVIKLYSMPVDISSLLQKEELDIPSYYQQELDETKETLKDLFTPNSFKCIIINDIHIESEVTYQTIIRQVDCAIKIANDTRTDIDCFVINGDLANGSGEAITTISLPFLDRLVDYIEANFKIPCYKTRGNHDFYTNKVWNYHLGKPNSKGAVFDTENTYFYKDFHNKRVRVIGLDTHDKPEGDDWQPWAVSEEQVRWFIKRLEETPNDYNVVLFSHIGFLDNFRYDAEMLLTPLRHHTSILNVINAFNNKTSMNWTELEATFNVNFTNNLAGKVLVNFVGHSHLDCIHKDATRGYLTVVNGSARYSRSNSLVDSLNALGTVTSWEYPETRVQGTRTEGLFSVFIVDGSKLNRVRFGAGTDKEVSY